MDTLHNPRAVIGGNEPPLADRLALDHADLVREAAEAAALVPAVIRAIETDDEAAAYTDTAAEIKGILAQADAAFKVEKAPWLEGGRKVDDFFAAIRDPMKASAARVKRALDDRANALLVAQRRAEAEAAAQARAAAEAENERLRKEAAAFDEPAPLPVAAAYVAPTAAKDVARVVSSGTGNKAAVSTKWIHNVTNPDLVPRQYLRVDDDAIKLALKRGVRSIPGVEIIETANTAIRRR